MKADFITVWNCAKKSGGMLKKSMLQDTEQDTKYKHVTYAAGTFYYQGKMYRIDNGKEVEVYSEIDMEMMRIAEMIDNDKAD